MTTIILPWPDSALSPNASKRHWRSRQAAKVLAKNIGYCAAYPMRADAPQGKLHLTVKLHPPDYRRRDMDNMLASLKPHLVGVCQALDIDDVWIRRVTLEWGSVETSGQVMVRLEVIEWTGAKVTV